METHFPVYIGEGAVAEFISFCNRQNLSKFLLVSDKNTYTALGAMVEEALREQGANVSLVVLEGKEVVADEHYLIEVLRAADRQERTFLAVGSGTITDITRFDSHRTKASFISLPTAPSVDGYTSLYAPLVIGGFKQSVPCFSPLAVFADLRVLSRAPHRMIAAGFGDLIGKFVAVADWKLGHLIWGEPYDEAIARRSRQAAQNCAGLAGEIAAGSAKAIHFLMEGLIESGFCMLDAGNSAPASGAEHHISHHWEMRLLQEGRPALLHGAKVGVGSVIASGWYEKVGKIDVHEASDRLKDASLPEAEIWVQEIRSVYGPAAAGVIKEQSPFIHMPAQRFVELKQRILVGWSEIQEIAASVPSPVQLTDWLRQAGAPVSGGELGLNETEIRQAMKYSHYLRGRFTINKLRLMLGIE
jgi:glycerol-1-phosphate dehydrogenase [NAD(P)+]